MKKLVALLIVSFAFATAPAFSADLKKGAIAYEKGDYETALREFLPLAEEGHAEAQYNLGLLYDNGWGVSQDYKIALKWFRLSAEQGVSVSQFSLGVMYQNGQGVVQDDKQAVKWYRLAAEQGDAHAQNNLAVMYEKGLGVLQDYVSAHMWYNTSALNNQELALENRDNLAEKMTPSQIEKAQDLAKKCLANNYQGC